MADRVQFTKALLLGLNAVPKTGVPGNVLAWGQDAFCALETSSGGCPLGGATFGGGRVLAFGHNNYFHGVNGAGNAAESTKRLTRVLRNSVLWAGKAECEYLLANNIAAEFQCGVYCENSDTSLLSGYPFFHSNCRMPLKIGGLGMKMDKLKHIVDSISAGSNDKFTAVAVEDSTTNESVANLLKRQLDVVLWTNTNSKQEVTPSATELDARAEMLLQFVNQGGGVIIAVCPWGWQSLSGGDHLSSRCVFNHFLEKVGLMYKPDYCSGDVGGNYKCDVALTKVSQMSSAETLNVAATTLAQRRPLDKTSIVKTITTLDSIPDVAFAPQTRSSHRGLVGRGEQAISQSVDTLANIARTFGAPNLKFPMTLKEGITFEKSAAYVYLPWFERHWQSLPPEQCPKAAGVADFPGDVPTSTPRVSGHLFTVNPKLQGWQTSGIYVVPGEPLYLTMSDQAIAAHKDLKLIVRVGSHTDTLKIIKSDDEGYKLNRFQNLNAERQWTPRQIAQPSTAAFCRRSSPETASTIVVATPYGGLLYLEFKDGWNSKQHPDVPITLNIEGGVLAPYWSMVREADATPTPFTDSYPHRAMSIADRAANFGAPWGELEGRYIIFTMSREALRNVHEPLEVMTFWDNMLAHELALAGQSLNKKERLVHDKQISVGWLHSGYPVMAHLDGLELTSRRRPKIADVENMKQNAQWGLYHEFGHNRQKGEWTWNGCGEVTVNIFSLYATQMLNGPSPYKSEYFSKNCKGQVERYLSDNSQGFADKWQKTCNIALGTYVVFIEEFGWPAIADTFRAYEKLKDKPKTESDKINEWVRQTSLRTGMDLRPYYSQWRFPLDQKKLAADLDPLPKYSKNVLQCIRASS